MTPERRAAARGYLAASTPGAWLPWVNHIDGMTEPETVIMGDSVGPAVLTSRVAVIEHPERGDAEFIAAAREDLPAALDAIDAVLALHYPRPSGRYRGRSDCAECSGKITVVWPCATVRAIEGAS